MNSPKGLSVVAFLLIFLVPIISIATPVPIPVAKVSGGEKHTLILTEANSVWSCGNNSDPSVYTLGDGTNINRYVPVQVHGPNDVNCLQNIIEISAGWQHSLELDSSYHIWAHGSNGAGQLGDGSKTPRSVPIRVHGGEQGAPYLQNIICISAGRSGQHSLAIDANHYVWSWGFNNCGQLGNGKFSGLDPNTLPVRVHAGEQTPGEPNANPLRYITKVSAGSEHSVALDANHFVYSWGSNAYSDGILPLGTNGRGLLGINDIQRGFVTTPVRVRGVNNDANGLRNIIAISAGWGHSMALEKINPNDPNCKGRVYTWGDNRGGYYMEDAGISCGGRLGNNHTDGNSPVPIRVHAGQQNPGDPCAVLQNIKAISAGANHCIALDVNGSVLAWGDNHLGQLGTGNYSCSATPVRVLAPDRNGDGQPDDLDGNPGTIDYLGDDVPIVSISAGYWHNLAVDQFGQAYAWGKGLYGRLGITSADKKNIPIPFYIYDLNVYNQRTGKWYKRIQPAINEAINNDIIIAYEGNYSENVNFVGNKAVTLRSVDPNNWSVVNNTRIYGSYDTAVSLTRDYENYNYDSKISGLTITNGSPGISASDVNITVDRCNIADNGYCGIYVEGGSSVVARIRNNIIHHSGCGIRLWGASCEIRNNIIHHNDSHGYGIYLEGSPCEIRNNTIADNGSYGIYKEFWNSEPDNINGNIIWGNTWEIYTYNGSFNNVNYNCIQDGWGSGLGNISSDPCFRNPDVNDYHLKYTSQCIDKGDLNFIAQAGETDIDGEDRIIDGNSDGSARVDMGADEFHLCSGRVDMLPTPPDGIVNFLDFVVLADAWMTGNGDDGYNDVVDFADNSRIDVNDLAAFCGCWLYATDGYENSFVVESEPGPPLLLLPPVDANIIIRIVDINDNNEITIDVNESITLYLRLTTTEQGSLGILDVDVMISDTNLGSIDNREYDANDPNDPNNGTARILAEPRDPFFDYVGPGYEQPEGIILGAVNLGAGFDDGNLASFVFTCTGQGDVTLSLKNYLMDTYLRLESILIHQNSQQMMMGGGGMAMESSQMSEDVDVDELADWLDQLWQTDEEIRESMSQDEYLEFRESIEESGNY